MGKRLFHAYHTFRQTVLEMDAIYQSLVGLSLVESTGLFRGSTSKIPEGIWPAEITLPAMTITQIALYDLLLSIGVKPRALIGHSAGETALLYASGAGSKAMALELAVARARSMKLVESAEYGMAALGCGLNTAVGLVDQAKHNEDGVLEIGAINSPDAVLVSGTGALLNHLIDVAKSDGIFARRVQSLVPSHSSLMGSCRKQYMEGVTAVFSRHSGLHRPAIRTYSTVAGQPRITTRFTPEYFWDNLRNPVHFHQGTTSVLDDFPGAVFVEISPHPALSSYIAPSVGHNRVFCPMRRPKTQSDTDAEVLAFTRTIGDLILLGVNQIDLTTLYGRPSRDPAYTIPYPFADRYFPMRIDGPRSHSGVLQDGSSLHLQINAKTHPDLAQHVINGEPIMPGAGFLDMVSGASSRPLRSSEVSDIEMCLRFRSLGPTSRRAHDVGCGIQGHPFPDIGYPRRCLRSKEGNRLDIVLRSVECMTITVPRHLLSGTHVWLTPEQKGARQWEVEFDHSNAAKNGPPGRDQEQSYSD